MHREAASPEVWLIMTTVAGGEPVVEFLPDEELDGYVDSYVKEGWTLASVRANGTFQGKRSVWAVMGVPPRKPTSKIDI